jgi:mRNA-degrading endonuclease RelE of RelBE toxin-antitoxin system
VLEFRETEMFTRAITTLLTDDDYAKLQNLLVLDPATGDLIPGTRGLRKLRWHHAGRGKGKRGGIRVIYYWYVSGSLLYMLLAYSKGEQDDITSKEKRLLSTLVAEEFK